VQSLQYQYVSTPQIKRKFLVLVHSAVPEPWATIRGYLDQPRVMRRRAMDREPRITHRARWILGFRHGLVALLGESFV
jgi:hypothetical protein